MFIDFSLSISIFSYSLDSALICYGPLVKASTMILSQTSRPLSLPSLS